MVLIFQLTNLLLFAITASKLHGRNYQATYHFEECRSRSNLSLVDSQLEEKNIFQRNDSSGSGEKHSDGHYNEEGFIQAKGEELENEEEAVDGGGKDRQSGKETIGVGVGDVDVDQGNNNSESQSYNNTSSSNSGLAKHGESESKYFLSSTLVNSAIVAAGYGEVSSDQCDNFIRHLQDYGIEDPVVAAIALAQLVWESADFRFNRELICFEIDCSVEYSTDLDIPGKEYGGRGYIQLTWAYNYLDASTDLYGDDRLLQNPDLVLDDEVNWDITFWYLGKYVFNSAEVLQGKFGASTNAINGALECRGGFQDKALKRFDIYAKILSVFSPDSVPDESGCYN